MLPLRTATTQPVTSFLRHESSFPLCGSCRNAPCQGWLCPHCTRPKKTVPGETVENNALAYLVCNLSYFAAFSTTSLEPTYAVTERMTTITERKVGISNWSSNIGSAT